MKKFVKKILFIVLSILPLPQHPTLRGEGLHLGWRIGWIRGWIRRPLWWMQAQCGGPRLSFGKRFSLQGKLQCRGPGSVVFGDDVIVDAVTTPYTHSPSAVIRIGDRCFVNGTRFGCTDKIEVGSDCILADARIMDTDFHGVSKNRNDPCAVIGVSPVSIGKNVWIAAGVAVLKGVQIGDDSVVAFGSVVTKSLPSGRIAGGNPAKDLAEVPYS